MKPKVTAFACKGCFPERLLESDRVLVRDVLAESELTDEEREAFEEMRDMLDTGRATLSDKQRAWVRNVGKRAGADIDRVMDRWKKGEIPRGNEVETPAVLRRENLPMKPPGRR